MINDFTKKYQGAVKRDRSLPFKYYSLKKGIYVLLSSELTWEENLQTIDDRYFIIDKKESYAARSLKERLKVLDYYSSVLFDSSNKMIDLPARKIHSATPLAFFMKEQTFLFDKKEEEMSESERKKVLFPQELKVHIADFYRSIDEFDHKLFELYPITAKKKKDKEKQINERTAFFAENYPQLTSALEDPNRKRRNDQVRQFLIDNMDEMIKWLKEKKAETGFSNYVKLFFDFPVDVYRLEADLYLIQKIFTVNDYCAADGSSLVGLPSGDMTVNAKKPYMVHQTMRTKVPLRIPADEAIARKDLYKWLEGHGKFQVQKHPYQVFFSEDGQAQEGMYYLTLDSDSSVVYFDNVPFRAGQRKLRVPIKMIDYDQERKAYQEHSYVIDDRGQLYHLVNQFFFRKQMKGNWLTGEIKVNEIMTPQLQTLLIQSREAWFDFLHKGVETTIKPMINRISRAVLTELLSVNESRNMKPILQAFYLRLGLLDHLGEKIDGMKGEEIMDYLSRLYHETDQRLDQKEEPFSIQNDNQFYYLAGQLTYYLASQSEAANMTHDLYRPVVTATGDPGKMKARLEEMRRTYAHRIKHGYARFESGFAAVMGYLPDEKVSSLDRELLLAGLLSKNLFFKKKEAGKNENKESDHA